MDEVHTLMNLSTRPLTMEMSEKQYDSYWSQIAPGGTERLHLEDIATVINTYDMWRFEKSRKEEILRMYTN